MKKALNSFARFYLPALVYLVFVFFLFRYATDAAAQNTQLSLRYTDAPLTGSQVGYAKGYIADPDNASIYNLTFWYQLQGTYISNDFGQSDTSAVFVDGEMYGVYPVEFITGGYPTSLDKNGIAVSEMLAWRLFGGGDAVGSTIKWDGVEYTVRGVFEGLDPMLLAQIDGSKLAEPIFTGVEVAGQPDFGDPRTLAVEFAQKLNLGKPTAVVDGSAMAALMMLMALLPALVLVVWFLIKSLRQLHRVSFWPRQLIWFAVLLGLALVIPWAMEQLPGWMVPNKWSDLDAWSDFFTNMRGYIFEWLALYPSMRDVTLKLQLIRQALLMFGGLTAVGITIRVWNARLTDFLRQPPGTAVVLELAVEEEAQGETLLLEAGAELHVDDLTPDDFILETTDTGGDADPRLR